MDVGNEIFAVSDPMKDQSHTYFRTKYNTTQVVPTPHKRQPRQPPRPEDEPNKKQPSDIPPAPKPSFPPD